MRVSRFYKNWTGNLFKEVADWITSTNGSNRITSIAVVTADGYRLSLRMDENELNELVAQLQQRQNYLAKSCDRRQILNQSQGYWTQDNSDDGKVNVADK